MQLFHRHEKPRHPDTAPAIDREADAGAPAAKRAMSPHARGKQTVELPDIPC